MGGVPHDLPSTLGALRASGHALRGVKAEIRHNLLAALQAGRDPWPGIVGFEGTVLPQLERALLAGHDVVLLGERGQGKTRLLRALVGLLDEWTPVIAGAELGEHPYAPITPASRRRAAELGDDLPVDWRHRSERYTEKLATPDTAVADLIGDIDPVKVAEGRSLGDPETIHYGLVPRAHRGIVAINELPDLAERIQVSLLNVMEERDIQVRGYTLRLPARRAARRVRQPRGLHQPRADHHAAEGPVRRRGAHALPVGAGRRDRAGRPGGRPGCRGARHLREVVARFTRSLRESNAIDQGSGVSARFAVAAAETVAAAALRRAALTGEARAVARPVDLESVPDVLRGKLEFASGEEGRESEHLEHLLRRATADTARARLRGIDLTPLAEAVSREPVRTGERVPAAEVVAALPTARSVEAVLTEVAKRLDAAGTEEPGPMASAAELALELLFLTRRLAKDEGDDDTVRYG